jgi:hypothetical protein
MVQQQAIDLVNSRPDAVTLWFEPWAESVQVEPGGVVQLIYAPQRDNALCIEYDGDSILVHGIPGSTLKAYNNGKQIWESYSTPEMPDELS